MRDLFLFILTTAAVILQGCCGAPITSIREVEVKVPVPAIHDTVHTIDYDTVVVAQKITERDTVVDIRYYPKLKYIEYKIKPDTVTLRFFDTVQVVKTAPDKSEVWYLPFVPYIALLVGAFCGIFIGRALR